jgi:hypothetical protein
MSRDERRKARDPVLWQLVRARLARIKVAQTTKRTHELVATMPPNWIEKAILPDPKHRGKP